MVETEGSTEFGRVVLDPLRADYPDLTLLSLDQAARRFGSEHAGWDVVVVELARPPAEDWRGRTGASLFGEAPEASADELVAACTGTVPAVVVCCAPDVPLEVRQHLAAAGAHTVSTAQFAVDLIEDIAMLCRAGLPISQPALDAYIELFREHYQRAYPLPGGRLRALLELELPQSHDQAWLVMEACDSLEEQGTGAAQALSRAFPSAAVVKVSASGGRIRVFRGGVTDTDQY